jgi:transcriptional regulator with GAF, ATPase, and Fis domain
MPVKAWHCFYPLNSALSIGGEFVKSLRKAGIDPHPYSPETTDANGILVASKVDSELFNLIGGLTARGQRRVLLVTLGNTRPDDVWRLIACGASDVLCQDAVSDLFANIAARFKRWKLIDRMMSDPRVTENLIGTSRVWHKTLRQIVEVAIGGELSILITGESGTGKELAAQLIHALDEKRRTENFVVLDCTTLVPELSGSEFFGHDRGSFTGAVSRREGAFALADGGTLFLDEVGELPLALQAGLLRVIQEKRFKPVGSNTWKKTDFRLICATNVDLDEQQKQGAFRSDLYHRIATWSCKMPALRERADDIIPLAHHFLAAETNGNIAPVLDPAVADYLRRRAYPGNVRELYQLIKRIVCLHAGDGPITCGEIPEGDRPDLESSGNDWRDDLFELSIRKAIFSGADLESIKKCAEDTAEIIALQEAGNGERNGRVARAAEMLKINKRTLEMHIKQRNDRLRGLIH